MSICEKDFSQGFSFQFISSCHHTSECLTARKKHDEFASSSWCLSHVCVGLFPSIFRRHRHSAQVAARWCVGYISSTRQSSLITILKSFSFHFLTHTSKPSFSRHSTPPRFKVFHRKDRDCTTSCLRCDWPLHALAVLRIFPTQRGCSAIIEVNWAHSRTQTIHE